MTCLKVAGADGAIGLMNQDDVWADGLVTVMFDDVWLAFEFGEKHREEGRAGDMNDVGPPNQPPKWKQRRGANDAEWECAIVEPVRGSFCGDDDIPFIGTMLGELRFTELTAEERDDRFDTADAGSEVV